MISIKSPREIEAMRKAGRLTAQARALADELEKLVGRKYWPFPTYSEMLFYM